MGLEIRDDTRELLLTCEPTASCYVIRVHPSVLDDHLDGPSEEERNAPAIEDVHKEPLPVTLLASRNLSIVNLIGTSF